MPALLKVIFKIIFLFFFQFFCHLSHECYIMLPLGIKSQRMKLTLIQISLTVNNLNRETKDVMKCHPVYQHFLNSFSPLYWTMLQCVDGQEIRSDTWHCDNIIPIQS